MQRCITQLQIENYLAYLQQEERAPATLQKYRLELRRFCDAMQGAPLTKETVMRYKQSILGTRAVVTVNAALVAVNGMLAWLG